MLYAKCFCKMLKWWNYIVFFMNFMEAASNCSMETYGLYCSNMKTNNESDMLVLNLIESNSTNVKSIFLRNSSGSIGENTFTEYSKIDSLDIQFCSIKNITTDLESLHMLYLMNNSQFPNISDSVMKHFPELRILYISNNHQLKIQPSSLKHLKNLQHLTISGQEIKNLSNNYFEGLNELSYLNLEGNGIEHVDENAFNNMTKLNHLILNDNKIRQFKEKTFTSLPNLESLELIGINLTTLDPKVFRSQGELKYIGIPSELVKNLKLKQLTNTFKKLESIGLLYHDQNTKNSDNNDTSIDKFIEICTMSGFVVKLVKK